MFSNTALMSPEFDEVSYLRHTLHLPDYQAEESRIQGCIDTIAKNVHSIIADNSSAMLSQVSAACEAQREVSAVRQSVVSLVHSSSLLRHSVEEPYNVIQSKITEMRNTSAALELLRNVQKFLALVARLPDLMGSDLTRAARHLRELEDLLRTADIRGIEVVDRHIANIDKSAAAVRSRALDLLRSPPSGTHSATDVAVALQCFFTMGGLPKVMNNFITEQKRDVVKDVMKELDLQVITEMIANTTGAPSALATPGVDALAARTRDVLLCQIERALASAVQHTEAILLVWKVLSKKKDPVTHARYLSAFDNPHQLLQDYWVAVSERLRERLATIQKRPNLLAVLSGAYVSFYSLLQGFLGRVHEFLLALVEPSLVQSGSANSNGPPPLPGDAPQALAIRDDVAEAMDALRSRWLAQVAGELESRFIAQLQDTHRERMHVLVSKMATLAPVAGAENMPVNISVDINRPHTPMAATAIDVRVYLKVAIHDTMAYRQEERALNLTLGCILHALQQFLDMAHELSSKTPLPPLPSVAATVTSNQLFHICIANACAVLRSDLSSLLVSLPEDRRVGEGPGAGAGFAGLEARQYTDHRFQLRDTVARLETMCNKTLVAFFSSTRVQLLSCVSRVTQGNADDDAPIAQLQTQTQNFVSRFLYLFDPLSPQLEEQCRGLAEVLLARLVAGVILMRPLTVNGSAVRHALRCITQIPEIIATVPLNSSSRTLIVLKGQLHLLKSLITAEQVFLTAASGAADGCSEILKSWGSCHPLLRQLHLLQLGGPGLEVLRAAEVVVGLSKDALTEAVQLELIDEGASEKREVIVAAIGPAISAMSGSLEIPSDPTARRARELFAALHASQRPQDGQ